MNTMAIVNSFGECVATMNDPLNLEQKRTTHSQRTGTYNCGGYAFETYNWLLPFFSGNNFSPFVWREVCKINRWEYDENELENGNTEGEIIYENCETATIEELVSIITKLNEQLDEDEAYDLAYRIFSWGEYDAPAAMILSIKHLLNAFPDLRLIKNFSKLKDDEYGIAYACGGGDFHFIKYKNGFYSHKMGMDEICVVNNMEETFSKLGYNSKIILFAKKINKKIDL